MRLWKGLVSVGASFFFLLSFFLLLLSPRIVPEKKIFVREGDVLGESGREGR